MRLTPDIDPLIIQNEPLVLISVQCDRMEKLFFQYLAIYYNENMPNGHKNSQSRSKIGQIQNKPCKKLLNTLIIWPKWRNFAKSGHTVSVCLTIWMGCFFVKSILFSVTNHWEVSLPNCLAFSFFARHGLVSTCRVTGPQMNFKMFVFSMTLVILMPKRSTEIH